MNSPVAHTNSGTVTGVVENGIDVFRGIPYSAPPVGALRWQPPQAHAGWEGVREAREFGPAAWQPYIPGMNPVAGDHGEPPFDEDALTLNIWTPAADGQRRPVLFWIHGGGLLTGSGAVPYYSGDRFARAGDIVVVTINYRLGGFGLLQGLGASDNVWLDDIAAAVKWVSDNISEFGGDPDRITVAGQSAGGYAVGGLLNHPVASGLFARVIVQSAPLGWQRLTREQAFERTEALAEMLEVPDVQVLRQLPAEAIVGGSMALLGRYGKFGEYNVPLLPVADDDSLAMDPQDALAQTDLDVLIGWTEDEMTLAFAFDPQYADVPREAIVNWASQRHEAPEKVYDAYAAGGSSPLQVLSAIYGDDLFRRPSLNVAERRMQEGRSTFVYEFRLDSPAAGGAVGAMHTIELPFVFDAVDRHAAVAELVANIPEETTRRLSSQMQQAWISFVRTGDPGTPRLPWPSFDDGRQLIAFDEDTRLTSDIRAPWREAGEK